MQLDDRAGRSRAPSPSRPVWSTKGENSFSSEIGGDARAAIGDLDHQLLSPSPETRRSATTSSRRAPSDRSPPSPPCRWVDQIEQHLFQDDAVALHRRQRRRQVGRDLDLRLRACRAAEGGERGDQRREVDPLGTPDRACARSRAPAGSPDRPVSLGVELQPGRSMSAPGRPAQQMETARGIEAIASGWLSSWRSAEAICRARSRTAGPGQACLSCFALLRLLGLR